MSNKEDSTPVLSNQVRDSMYLQHQEFSKFEVLDNKVAHKDMVSILDMMFDNAVFFEVAKTLFGRNAIAVFAESTCDAISKAIVSVRKDISIYEKQLGQLNTIQNDDGTQNGEDVGRSPKSSDTMADKEQTYIDLIKDCEGNIKELLRLGSCFYTLAKEHEGDKEIASSHTRSANYNNGANLKFNHEKLSKIRKDRKYSSSSIK